MNKEQSGISLGIGIFVVILPYLFFQFGDQAIVRASAREDGIIESIGAICLLVASICFFILYLKSSRGNDLFLFKTGKNIFWILLAIVFFFGFGEEISWGQRIIGWETPEELLDSNNQDETNLHNLEIIQGGWLSIGRLFTLFWLSYCVLVPILNRFLSPMRSLFNKVNLPIVALSLAALFMLNYIIHFALSPENELQGSINEIKESVVSFLFMMASLYFLRHHKGT